MCNLMAVEFGDNSEESISQVMKNVWKYSQTYSIGNVLHKESMTVIVWQTELMWRQLYLFMNAQVMQIYRLRIAYQFGM